MADISLIIDVESKEVSRAVDELIRMRTAAKDTGKAFEQGFKKIISWQERFRGEQGRVNATLEKNFLAQQKANKSAKDSAMVFQKQEADLKKVALANRRLRMEYKEGYAAQVALRAAQMRLNQARRQGIITDEEYRRQLDRLGDSAQNSTRHMSRAGVAMQQTGYQVGDFLVQIQSGTNPMVAFGQQATQLVGVLYMLPAATLAGSVGIMGLSVSVGVLIASLGIIIPLATAIGAAFMRTRKEAEESSDGIDSYAGALKEAREEIKKTTLELAALRGGFADVLEYSLDSQIKSLRADLIPLVQGYNSYLEEQAELIREIGEVTETDLVEALESAAEQYRNSTEEGQKLVELEKALAELVQKRAINRGMEDRQAMLEAEAEALQEINEAVAAIRDTMAAQTLDMQNRIALLQTEAMFGKESEQLAVLQAQQARDAFIEEQKRNGILGNNLKAQLEIYDALVAAGEELAEVNRALVAAGEELAEVNRNQDALKRGAEGLLGIWTSIVGKIKEATPMGPSVAGGRGTSPGATAEGVNRYNFEAQLASNKITPRASTSGGAGGVAGGASGATDPLLGQMEQLETFLATERELLLVEYETRQMTLEQSLEKEYLTRQQYADMTLELEGRKNKELGDIERKTQQQKVSIVAGGIQDVLNAAANGNERLLKAARVFGAAEALINSYRAASQTLADPTLPFYVKFGAAASVLAAGFGMVNAIKGGGSSKSMSGGLSGGGATSRPSGAEASVPTQSAPQAQRVLIKGLGPKDLLTGEMLQELFDKLYDENQERGAVFMVST